MTDSQRDAQLYNSISSTYATTRREDTRVAAQIHRALDGADRIVNVGAGTGNYEPAGRAVTAVEPSNEMIVRRAPGRAPVVQATAEDLPFADGSFEAAMACLTLHHWRDRNRGLAEMQRVADRQVIFMFDPDMTYKLWVVDYWPTALALPSEQDVPSAEDLRAVLPVVDIEVNNVPIDCTDGFGAAFWGRPEAYLDPDVQQGMSWLAQLPTDALAAGSAKLDTDLRSGEWDQRYGNLRELPELDVGYRLVIAQS